MLKSQYFILYFSSYLFSPEMSASCTAQQVELPTHPYLEGLDRSMLYLSMSCEQYLSLSARSLSLSSLSLPLVVVRSVGSSGCGDTDTSPRTGLWCAAAIGLWCAAAASCCCCCCCAAWASICCRRREIFLMDFNSDGLRRNLDR